MNKNIIELTVIDNSVENQSQVSSRMNIFLAMPEFILSLVLKKAVNISPRGSSVRDVKVVLCDVPLIFANKFEWKKKFGRILKSQIGNLSKYLQTEVYSNACLSVIKLTLFRRSLFLYTISFTTHEFFSIIFFKNRTFLGTLCFAVTYKSYTRCRIELQLSSILYTSSCSVIKLIIVPLVILKEARGKNDNKILTFNILKSSLKFHRVK